ncbi:MAG: hypothetical protein GY756_03050 [bacterium]|nr:hypothetical protein [bacterium]
MTNSNKIFKLFFIILTLCAICTSAFSLTSKNNIQRITYTGKVTPLIKTYISYAFDDDMPGRVLYAAREGTIAKGPIFTENGKIIEESTILVKFHPGRREKIYKQALANLKAMKATLQFAKYQYERNKKLSKVHSVSLAAHQQSEAKWFQALADYERLTLGAARAKTWLDNTIIRASFDCIVTKVLFPYGLCSVSAEILKIAQLDPMGISIKIKRADAYKINNTTPIMVFPNGSDKPVGVYSYNRIITENGVIFRIKNRPLPPPVKLKKQYNYITECFSVELSLYKNKKILSVPVNAILKDKKGKFVWKGVGENLIAVDKGINYVFPVKKIYIETENMIKNLSPHQKYITIKTQNDLHEGDLILRKSDLPKNLKNNDKVCFYQKRYLFMPGDKVRVVIDFNKTEDN